MSNGNGNDPDVWVRRLAMAWRIVREVGIVVAALAGFTAMVFGYLNHQTGQEVRQQVEQHGPMIERTEEKVDKAADAATAVKARLESKETGK